MPSLERLEQFYPFDESVLERVAAAAESQNGSSFTQLTARYGIEEGPHVVPGNETHKAFELLTIKPREDYDASYARVYHLPISMPIDPNMIMRAVRLFEADPTQQLVLSGNPSAAGQHFGKLRFRDMKQAWDGDLSPVVDPLLSYLSKAGVETTEELGFSYGADKAAASAARAEAHDISVERGVWMESAAVDKRGPGLIGPVRLGIDFMSAGNELENYVEACDSPPLDEARELADVGLPRYILGLGRLSNLALINSLAHGGFPERARKAMIAQRDLRAAIVWGTDSELSKDSSMAAESHRLRAEFGADRVKSLAMEGMHHAGGDDIDLHAAIVLQALKA